MMTGAASHAKRKGEVLDADPISIRDAARCQEAQLGSELLSSRIHDMFERFAERHGVSIDHARILLLDTGVRL